MSEQNNQSVRYCDFCLSAGVCVSSCECAKCIDPEEYEEWKSNNPEEYENWLNDFN